MISYRGEQAAQRNVRIAVVCGGDGTGWLLCRTSEARGEELGICRCSELLGRQDWACDWRWVTGPSVTTTLLWTGEDRGLKVLPGLLFCMQASPGHGLAKQQAGTDRGAPVSLLRARQTVSFSENPTKVPSPFYPPTWGLPGFCRACRLSGQPSPWHLKGLGS